jgi:hypothetical protein
MRARIAVPVITLAVGIPAFLLSQVIWPPAPGNPTPSGAQLPLFMLLFIVEALLFGLGVAFLAFGFPLVRQAAGRIGMDPRPVYVAIAWQLVSWWPHDNFHMATGMDLNGLLMIEYAFHMTLILSALVVARFFLATLRAAVAAPPVTQPAPATSAIPAGSRG